jgi:hypothetical protein
MTLQEAAKTVSVPGLDEPLLKRVRKSIRGMFVIS